MQVDFQPKEYEQKIIDSLTKLLPPEVACMVFLVENDMIKFICQQLPKEYMLEVLKTAIKMIEADNYIKDSTELPPSLILLN
jgi:hypothetical protein